MAVILKSKLSFKYFLKNGMFDFRVPLLAFFIFGSWARIWGIWFPHTSWDEGQLIQGGYNLVQIVKFLILCRFQDILDVEIVSIYGIAGKYFAIIPYIFSKLVDGGYYTYVHIIGTRVFVSCLPSILTLYFIDRICIMISDSKLFRIGAMASLAVSFIHIETAHYAVPHSLVTLFTVLCLFYLMRAVSQGAKTSDILACATFAALSASTKINVGACLVLTIILSLVIRARTQPGHKLGPLKFLVYGIITFVIISILVNIPYLLHWREWWDEIYRHLTYYNYESKGHFLFYFFINPPFGIGAGCLIVSLLGILISLQKKYIKSFYPLLFFLFVFYTFLSTSKGAIDRWIIPMLPVMAVFGGLFLMWLYEFSHALAGHIVSKTLATFVIIIIVMAQPAYHIFLFNLNLAENDTTYLLAARYINNHGPADRWVTGVAQHTVSKLIPTKFKDVKDVEGLESGSYDYTIFCDYFYPETNRYPKSLKFIFTESRSRTYKPIVKHIRDNWNLVATFKSKYHTEWGSGIAQQRIIWIYHRQHL